MAPDVLFSVAYFSRGTESPNQKKLVRKGTTGPTSDRTTPNGWFGARWFGFQDFEVEPMDFLQSVAVEATLNHQTTELQATSGKLNQLPWLFGGLELGGVVKEG